MRIFLAGATGVIGIRLLPLLVEAGHAVAGMTRSREKAAQLQALGAQPVVCNVFDAGALAEAVAAFGPDAVTHQLTDLPDTLDELDRRASRNDRMRRVGIELPLRMLIWQDPDGTHVGYLDPRELTDRYALDGHQQTLERQTAVLTKLAAAAAG